MTTEQLLEEATKLVGKDSYEIATALNRIYGKGLLEGVDAMAAKIIKKEDE